MIDDQAGHKPHSRFPQPSNSSPVAAFLPTLHKVQSIRLQDYSIVVVEPTLFTINYTIYYFHPHEASY